MFTKHNNVDYKTEWQYESPELVLLLQEKGIPVEEARKMKKVDLKELLNLETLPLPTMVKCIITNTETKESVANVVELTENERYSKEEMRKSSMGSTLRTIFPGNEKKGTRKVFFDSYLNRKMDNGLKKFLRQFSKYESKLEQLEKEFIENLKTV